MQNIELYITIEIRIQFVNEGRNEGRECEMLNFVLQYSNSIMYINGSH